MKRIYVRTEESDTSYVRYGDYDDSYKIRSGNYFYNRNLMSSWAAAGFAAKYTLSII